MNRVRRTLALVRASTPAVRSIVFSMRMKAAVAREVVARRHRTQAADLIHTALRVRVSPVNTNRVACLRHSAPIRILRMHMADFAHADVPPPPEIEFRK